MNTAFAFKIFLEIGAILLIAYGYMNEEKVIEFERELFKVMKFIVNKYVFKTYNNKNNNENARPVVEQNIAVYKPHSVSSSKVAQIKVLPKNVA